MAIETVKKGQGDWQTIFNALIALANVGGGNVEHLDDPLSWENGATGYSYAYMIQLLNGFKLVILTVAHVNVDKLSNGMDAATLPDNLTPDDNDFIRMALSQNAMLANIGDNKLALWINDQPTQPKDMYGTATFLVKA